MSHFWYIKSEHSTAAEVKILANTALKSKDFGVLVVRVWRKNRRILFVFCAHRGGLRGLSLVITKLFV